MNIAVIIVASGSGSRMNAHIPKQFLPLRGKTVLDWTIKLFLTLPNIHEIILVLPPSYIAKYKKYLSKSRPGPMFHIIAGGKRRVDSVKAGLGAVSKESDIIVIHDGVRPLTLPQDIKRCIDSGRRWGAAIAAAPCTDTVKRSNKNGFVHDTLDRTCVWLVQTPQVFKKEILTSIFKKNRISDVTDDSQLIEKIGKKVKIVPVGSYNRKITYSEDLVYAESVLKGRKKAVASCE